MVQYALRFVKRFAVLLPGIIIAYFSVRNIFPYFDRRLPLALAIFFTYVLAAYVLIPGVIRLWRIFRPADHLPLYCVTPDGFASDPLNVGIVGTRRQLIASMQKAGWHLADPHSLRNVAREILSTVYGWQYPTAPVSSLYLFGRKQDVAFEIPLEGVTGGRHHVRFWATEQGNDLLWVGAASRDIGINYIRHNLQLTHMIDADTDQERDLIIRHLRTHKLVRKVETITLGEPYRLINRVIGGALHTDGKMAVATLKQSAATSSQTRSRR
ncbi:MAG TPA: LssY C-terminal domain-containing protein [Verrucomicrobiae bacterium]|nr:LssY C-terminal domain-containing protein [Verrucomicrobiae bacterium]